MNQKKRLLALLRGLPQEAWTAAATEALRSPQSLLNESSGEAAALHTTDHFLAIYRRRRDHLARIGLQAAGLDQFLDKLTALPAGTPLTGNSFRSDDYSVVAFYGPSNELVGCITIPRPKEKEKDEIPPNLGISPRVPIAYPFYDIAWIASDANGQIGVFTTAAEAPIPLVSVRSPIARLVERRVNELPCNSDIKVWVEFKRPDDFVGFAKRGMYAFDWEDGISYRIIASPLAPITLKDLPPDLAALAQKTKIAEISFSAEPRPDIIELIDCLTAGYK